MRHRVQLTLLVNCNDANIFKDKSCPIFLDEKFVQELRVKENFSFVDTQKRVLESKPGTRNQSYSSVLCQSLRIDMAAETTAVASSSNTGLHRMPCVSVSTKAEDPSPTLKTCPSVTSTLCDSAYDRFWSLPSLFLKGTVDKSYFLFLVLFRCYETEAA